MKSSPAPPPAPLLLDWSHRARGTWWRLTAFIVLAGLAGAAGFYLFSVPTPEPTRGMPAPVSVMILPPWAGSTDGLGSSSLPSLAVPVPEDGLGLPEGADAETYQPSFHQHALPREPWPERPAPPAWPDLLGASLPTLPPPSPSPPSTAPIPQ